MSNKDEDLKHGKETALGRSGEQGECPRDLKMYTVILYSKDVYKHKCKMRMKKCPTRMKI